MTKAGVNPAGRTVVAPAREVEQRTDNPGAAIELSDGTIITERTSELLGCSSAMLLNALNHLACVDHDVHLLSRVHHPDPAPQDEGTWQPEPPPAHRRSTHRPERARKDKPGGRPRA
ncbi:hypothetical protein GCM10028828_07250 [Corynebacterium tapiri]